MWAQHSPRLQDSLHNQWRFEASWGRWLELGHGYSCSMFKIQIRLNFASIFLPACQCSSNNSLHLYRCLTNDLYQFFDNWNVIDTWEFMNPIYNTFLNQQLLLFVWAKQLAKFWRILFFLVWFWLILLILQEILPIFLPSQNLKRTAKPKYWLMGF